MRFQWAVAIALFGCDTAYGLVIPSCPADVCSSSAIVDLCSDELRTVGKVLLSHGDGYCWCQCPAAESLGSQRVAAQRPRLAGPNLQEAAPTDGADTDDPCGGRRLIRSDSSVTDWSVGCIPEWNLIETIRTIKAGLPHPLNDFNVQVHERVCETIWPSNQRRQEIRDTPQQIYYPLRMLYDANVGYELRMFMLLHEIGHDAWRERNEQGSTEYLADEWAARVGIPLVLQADWNVESGARFLDSVVTQLRRFHYSQYSTSTAHLANCNSGDVNCYPELQCRVKGIQGYYTVAADGQAGTDHPPECWDEVFTGGSRLDSCAFKQHPCEGWKVAILQNSTPFKPGKMEVVSMEMDAQRNIRDLVDPCRFLPCDCSGRIVNGPSAREMRRYERSRRRFLKHARLASERLHHLDDEKVQMPDQK